MDVLILEPLPDFEDFVIVYSKINKLLSGRVISSKYEKIPGLHYGGLFELYEREWPYRFDRDTHQITMKTGRISCTMAGHNS